MASISTDANGNRRILFTADGQRRTIRLGTMSMRQAEAVRLRIEQLLAGRESSAPDPAAVQWAASLTDKAHARLVRAGVVEPRDLTKHTLGGLLDAWFGTKTVKPATVLGYRQTRGALEAFFGADRPLATITPLEAEQWRKGMGDAGLAAATIAKRAKTARQVFERGVRWKMLATNPFAGLKGGSQANAARAFYITPEATAKVIDAAPDREWRLIIALCRYAGLRCPSELLGLTWGDVVWDKARLIVRSPKTEGHEGGADRVLPLFPEIREPLLEAFHAAEPGERHVITRYREANANLRTTFTKIIRRAGLKPWPRLFHNLRASCATDLVQRFPAHVVGAWLGHSVSIAERHYLQVRDAHFDLAAGLNTGGEKCTQKAAQSAPEQTRADRKRENANASFGLDVPHDAELCGSVPNSRMAPPGFEPGTERL